MFLSDLWSKAKKKWSDARQTERRVIRKAAPRIKSKVQDIARQSRSFVRQNPSPVHYAKRKKIEYYRPTPKVRMRDVQREVMNTTYKRIPKAAAKFAYQIPKYAARGALSGAMSTPLGKPQGKYAHQRRLDPKEYGIGKIIGDEPIRSVQTMAEDQSQWLKKKGMQPKRADKLGALGGVALLGVDTYIGGGKKQAAKEALKKGKPVVKIVRNKIKQKNDLKAVHNISEGNLLKSLKQGGMPAPSVAIVKKGEPFDDFGEISLIGKKGLIDPEKGSKTFRGDVYSPRYPQVYTMKDKKKMEKVIDEVDAFENGIDDRHRHMSRNLRMEDEALSIDDFLADAKTSPTAKGLYLKSKGGDVSPKTESTYNLYKKNYEIVNTKRFRQLIKSGKYPTKKDYKTMLAEITERYNKRYAHEPKFRDDMIDNINDVYGNDIGIGTTDRIDRLIDKIHNTPRRVNTEMTEKIFDKQIKKFGGDKNFEKWINEKYGDIYGSQYLKDGKRDVENTPQNALRIMSGTTRSQESSMFTGLGKIQSMLIKEYKSLKDIQKDRKYIKNDPSYDMSDAYYSLVDSITRTGVKAGDRYDQMDLENIAQILYKTYKKSKTGSGVEGALKNGGYPNVSNIVVGDVKKFMEMLKTNPVKYFESKPQRVVGMNEFTHAIVPASTSKEIKQAIRNAGMKVRIYKNGENRILVRNSTGENFAGAVAGIQQDEDGNVTFDPKMAALGVAGMSVARSKKFRNMDYKKAFKGLMDQKEIRGNDVAKAIKLYKEKYRKKNFPAMQEGAGVRLQNVTDARGAVDTTVNKFSLNKAKGDMKRRAEGMKKEADRALDFDVSEGREQGYKALKELQEAIVNKDTKKAQQILRGAISPSQKPQKALQPQRKSLGRMQDSQMSQAVTSQGVKIDTNLPKSTPSTQQRKSLDQPTMLDKGRVTKQDVSKSSYKKSVSGTSKIAEPEKEINGFMQNVRQTMSDTYTQAVNRYNPLEKVARGASKADDNKMRLALSQNYGAGSTAEGYVEFGLKPIFKNVDNLDDLRSYTVAQRDIELATRGLKGSEAATAKKTLTELKGRIGEKAYQKVKTTADTLYDYQDGLVQEFLVKTGVMSKASYAAMKKQNQRYIPFKRVMDNVDDSLEMNFGKSTSIASNTAIKKIKGSDKQIIDPMQSVIENTYKIISLGRRNKVAQAIGELQNTIPETITKIDAPAHGTALKETVSFMKNGERHYVKVPTDVAIAAKSLEEEAVSTIAKIIALPAKTLRYTATGANPGFAIPNTARDLFSAFYNVGLNPVRFGEGLAHLAKKDDVYKKFLLSGGKTSRLSLDRPFLKKTVEEISDKGLVEKLSHTVKNPKEMLRIFERAGEASEQGTRIAAFEKIYKKNIKKGMSEDEALKEAAYWAQEATVNFGRRGSKTKAVNAVIAFFNARLQGADRILRTAKSDPKGAATRLAIATIPAAIGLHQWNKHFESYDKDNVVPDYVKRDNFIIMLSDSPIDSLGGLQYITIPKGEIGRFANPTQEFLEYLEGEKDTKAVKEIAGAFGNLSPIQGWKDIIPTGALPIIENITNHDFFTKREVVPAYKNKKGIAEKEKYHSGTNSTYRLLGEKLNIAPAKIQNVMEGYFSGFENVVVGGTDMLVNAKREDLKKDQKGATINRMPVIRRLLSGQKRTEEEQKRTDFYKKKDEFLEDVKQFDPDTKEYKDAVTDYLLSVPAGDERKKAKQSLYYDGVKTTGISSGSGKQYTKEELDRMDDITKKAISDGYADYYSGTRKNPADMSLEELSKAGDVKSKVKELYKNENYTTEEKEQVLDKMGYTMNDAEWYTIAGLKRNAQKAPHVVEKIKMDDGFDEEAVSRAIDDGLLSTSMTKEMVVQGLISWDEKRQLDGFAKKKKSSSSSGGSSKAKKTVAEKLAEKEQKEEDRERTANVARIEKSDFGLNNKNRVARIRRSTALKQPTVRVRFPKRTTPRMIVKAGSKPQKIQRKKIRVRLT